MDKEKPLLGFDFQLVLPGLTGLQRNMDSDLQRTTERSVLFKDRDGERCVSLLKILFRFAWNSFHAVVYLAGDEPEDPRRKSNYVLVVPNINRQLLDLLFSLAYMFEDFSVRSLAYQRAGWRNLHEEREVFKETFGEDPEWEEYLKFLGRMLDQTALLFGISGEQQKNPKKLIFQWPNPDRLIKRFKNEPAACKEFLKYLEKWLYRDTSAQTHMTFGGVLKISMFLLAKDFGDAAVEHVNDRPMKTYRSTQICRTALLFLAIATEIDTHYQFGYRERIDYLWKIFADHAVEGKEMWELRYRDRFKLTAKP
jgi:hypothetical protein